MHYCLKIPEIFSLICQHVNTIEDHPSQSLLCLALTCRTFTDVATAELWTYIYDLGPILDSMGDNLASLEEPTLDDIEACRRLCSRIKVIRLELSTWSRDFIWCSVLQLCVEPFDLEPNFLLPDLRQFEIVAPGPTSAMDVNFIDLDFSPFLSLLGPPLLHLKIWSGLETRGRQSLLTGLREQCPNLRSLHWNRNRTLEAPMGTWFTSVIQPWTQIRGLRLSGPSAELILALSSLPSLSDLDICFNDENIPKSLPTVSQGGGFHALQNLQITVYDSFKCLEIFVPLLQLLQKPRLRELGLHVYPDPGVKVFRKILSILPQQLDHASLEKVTVGTESDLDPPFFKRSCDLSNPYDLHHLLAFPNLKHFTFPCNVRYAPLGPRLLQKFLTTMPGLETLEFGDWSEEDTSLSPFKLQDLVWIARALPNLARLGLPIDTSTAGAWLDLMPARGGLRRYSMRWLSIGYSPIDSPGDIAAFLADLFPHLESLNPIDPFEPGWRPDDDICHDNTFLTLEELVESVENCVGGHHEYLPHWTLVKAYLDGRVHRPRVRPKTCERRYIDDYFDVVSRP